MKAQGSVKLTLKLGLHARPAVKLTQLAKKFASQIHFGLSPEGPWIDAKSIAKVMRSKTPKDSILHFRAEGADADAAVRALIRFIERSLEPERQGGT